MRKVKNSKRFKVFSALAVLGLTIGIITPSICSQAFATADNKDSKTETEPNYALLEKGFGISPAITGPLEFWESEDGNYTNLPSAPTVTINRTGATNIPGKDVLNPNGTQATQQHNDLVIIPVSEERPFDTADGMTPECEEDIDKVKYCTEPDHSHGVVTFTMTQQIAKKDGKGFSEFHMYMTSPTFQNKTSETNDIRDILRINPIQTYTNGKRSIRVYAELDGIRYLLTEDAGDGRGDYTISWNPWNENDNTLDVAFTSGFLRYRHIPNTLNRNSPHEMQYPNSVYNPDYPTGAYTNGNYPYSNVKYIVEVDTRVPDDIDKENNNPVLWQYETEQPYSDIENGGQAIIPIDVRCMTYVYAGQASHEDTRPGVTFSTYDHYWTNGKDWGTDRPSKDEWYRLPAEEIQVSLPVLTTEITSQRITKDEFLSYDADTPEYMGMPRGAELLQKYNDPSTYIDPTMHRILEPLKYTNGYTKMYSDKYGFDDLTENPSSVKDRDEYQVFDAVRYFVSVHNRTPGTTARWIKIHDRDDDGYANLDCKIRNVRIYKKELVRIPVPSQTIRDGHGIVMSAPSGSTLPSEFGTGENKRTELVDNGIRMLNKGNYLAGAGEYSAPDAIERGQLPDKTYSFVDQPTGVLKEKYTLIDANVDYKYDTQTGELYVDAKDTVLYHMHDTKSPASNDNDIQKYRSSASEELLITYEFLAGTSTMADNNEELKRLVDQDRTDDHHIAGFVECDYIDDDHCNEITTQNKVLTGHTKYPLMHPNKTVGIYSNDDYKTTDLYQKEHPTNTDVNFSGQRSIVSDSQNMFNDMIRCRDYWFNLLYPSADIPSEDASVSLEGDGDDRLGYGETAHVQVKYRVIDGKVVNEGIKPHVYDPKTYWFDQSCDSNALLYSPQINFKTIKLGNYTYLSPQQAIDAGVLSNIKVQTISADGTVGEAKPYIPGRILADMVGVGTEYILTYDLTVPETKINDIEEGLTVITELTGTNLYFSPAYTTWLELVLPNVDTDIFIDPEYPSASAITHDSEPVTITATFTETNYSAATGAQYIIHDENEYVDDPVKERFVNVRKQVNDEEPVELKEGTDYTVTEHKLIVNDDNIPAGATVKIMYDDILNSKHTYNGTTNTVKSTVKINSSFKNSNLPEGMNHNSEVKKFTVQTPEIHVSENTDVHVASVYNAKVVNLGDVIDATTTFYEEEQADEQNAIARDYKVTVEFDKLVLADDNGRYNTYTASQLGIKFIEDSLKVTRNNQDVTSEFKITLDPSETILTVVGAPNYEDLYYNEYPAVLHYQVQCGDAKASNIRDLLDESFKIYSKLECSNLNSSAVADQKDSTIMVIDADSVIEPEPSPDDGIIPEGTYIITTKLSGHRALDIANGSSANMANLQTWTANGSAAQRFTLKYNVETDSYTIINVNSDKALDITNGRLNNFVNVRQYTDNGSAAQQWKIIDAGDGYYYIASAADPNYVLDISNASPKDGANVHIYKNNGSNAQKWIFNKDVDSIVIENKTIPDGIYEIVPQVAKNKRLDIANASIKNGANVQIWSANNTDAQKFKFEYDNQGYYTITNVKSGKVLDVQNAKNANGTNVWQYTSNNTDAQKWQVLENSDGETITLKNKATGKMLDITSGSRKDGANVQIWSNNATDAQKWILLNVL